jgi:hypothetical protein
MLYSINRIQLEAQNGAEKLKAAPIAIFGQLLIPRASAVDLSAVSLPGLTRQSIFMT